MRHLTGMQALLLMFLGAVANAQGPKVGYVNMTALAERTPEWVAAQERLRQEFSPRQRELVAKQAALQEKRDTYERDGPAMGAAERAALEREINEGLRQFQRETQTLQEDVKVRRDEEIEGLQRAVVRSVQAFARSQGYDMIVTDAVYANEGADITMEILATLPPKAASTEAE